MERQAKSGLLEPRESKASGCAPVLVVARIVGCVVVIVGAMPGSQPVAQTRIGMSPRCPLIAAVAKAQHALSALYELDLLGIRKNDNLAVRQGGCVLGARFISHGQSISSRQHERKSL